MVTQKFLKTETSAIASDVIHDLNNANVDSSRFISIAKLIQDTLFTEEGWIYAEMPMLVKEHPCLSSFKVEPIGSTIEGLSLAEHSEGMQCQEMDFTAIVQVSYWSKLLV